MIGHEILSTGIASVCGRRAGKWSAGGEKRLANRSRSATPRAEPQTEAAADAVTPTNVACDERTHCAAEWARSRGGKGRPEAREAEQCVRWSRRLQRSNCCLKRIASTVKTIWKHFHQIPRGKVSPDGSLVHSGRARTRGLEDCGVYAA